MTTKDAARIGLRLLGLYAIVLAIGQLQLTGMIIGNLRLPHVAGEGSWLPAVLSGVSTVFSFGFAAFLLMSADNLAARFVPTAQRESDTTARISPLDAQAVAFSVLGLYFVLKALPGMLQSISHVTAVLTSMNSTQPLRILLSVLLRLIGELGQFILGFVLFFHAFGLARFWHGNRRLGSKMDEAR